MKKNVLYPLISIFLGGIFFYLSYHFDQKKEFNLYADNIFSLLGYGFSLLGLIKFFSFSMNASKDDKKDENS